MESIRIINNNVQNYDTFQNSTPKTTDSTGQILKKDAENTQQKTKNATAVNEHGDTLHIKGTKKESFLSEAFNSAKMIIASYMNPNEDPKVASNDGIDNIMVSDSQNVSIKTFSGDDGINIYGNSNNITVDTGSDKDRVEIDKGVKNADIQLGDDSDFAKIQLSKNMEGMKHIDGGSGDNYLTLKLDRDMNRSDVQIIKDTNNYTVNVEGKPVIQANNFKDVNLIEYSNF